MEMKMIGLDNLLEILGNPTRRVILSKLAKVPHSTSELAGILNISRQAVHSQLKILSDDYGIIENIYPEERGGKYRIRSSISVRIDISPNYYNIKYKMTEINANTENLKLNEVGCSTDYEKIRPPSDKLRFLGKKIGEIEKEFLDLEEKRVKLIQKKECLIIEMKNIMDNQYKDKLMGYIKERQRKSKSIRESINLGKEILFTLFFNPSKYHERINIDSLLDDLFFTDVDTIQRAQNKIFIEPLLRDLSKLMGFLREEDDDIFFFEF